MLPFVGPEKPVRSRDGERWHKPVKIRQPEEIAGQPQQEVEWVMSIHDGVENARGQWSDDWDKHKIKNEAFHLDIATCPHSAL